ncbi:hypothetical protein GCM10011415_05900 [Salipiger pallidus]|uniref:Uncharacterized protein n=1 Tax=Salipiger pallidus TaxID=1775170 RepID=A0A8J2ZH28_9RHOB|nr:hypothetical protein GCM10011415_05900 [Salipiger pallidus]
MKQRLTGPARDLLAPPPEKGQSRFPDTRAALTVDTLHSISDVLGSEALDRVIATLPRYRAAMAGSDTTPCPSR